MSLTLLPLLSMNSSLRQFSDTTHVVFDSVRGMSTFQQVVNFMGEHDIDEHIRMIRIISQEIVTDEKCPRSIITALDNVNHAAKEMEAAVIDTHRVFNQWHSAWFFRGARFNSILEAQLTKLRRTHSRFHTRWLLLLHLLQCRDQLIRMETLPEDDE